MSFKPNIYTEIITLKISRTQKQTLDKLRVRNIKVSNFIRQAIKEKILRDVTGRLGVADVKTFGLSWEDCDSLMKKLGYKIKINAIAA